MKEGVVMEQSNNARGKKGTVKKERGGKERGGRGTATVKE